MREEVQDKQEPLGLAFNTLTTSQSRRMVVKW